MEKEEIEEEREEVEVTCNMCGDMMAYSDEDGFYHCVNVDCTRCDN